MSHDDDVRKLSEELASFTSIDELLAKPEPLNLITFRTTHSVQAVRDALQRADHHLRKHGYGKSDIEQADILASLDCVFATTKDGGVSYEKNPYADGEKPNGHEQG